MSSITECFETLPVTYEGREELFYSLFGSESESEAEPRSESTRPQILPFRKRSEFRELKNNVDEKEMLPVEKKEIITPERSMMKNEEKDKKEKKIKKSERSGVKYEVQDKKKEKIKKSERSALKNEEREKKKKKMKKHDRLVMKNQVEDKKHERSPMTSKVEEQKDKVIKEPERLVMTNKVEKKTEKGKEIQKHERLAMTNKIEEINEKEIKEPERLAMTNKVGKKKEKEKKIKKPERSAMDNGVEGKKHKEIKKPEKSAMKRELEEKNARTYIVRRTEGMKFVIQSYRKSEELRKKAELEKKKREEESSIEAEKINSDGKDKNEEEGFIETEKIESSDKKRKMNSEENIGNENWVDLIPSKKTSSGKAKQKISSVAKEIGVKIGYSGIQLRENMAPKPPSFKIIDSDSDTEKEYQVKKGKMLARESSSSNKITAEKPIRFKKSASTTNKGKGIYMKKKEYNGDNLILQRENLTVNPVILEKHETSNNGEESELGEDICLPGESYFIRKPKPTSSEKPYRCYKEKGKKKATKVAEKTNDSNADIQNDAKIPVIFKKPRSRRRNLPEHTA